MDVQLTLKATRMSPTPKIEGSRTWRPPVVDLRFLAIRAVGAIDTFRGFEGFDPLCRAHCAVCWRCYS